MRKIIGLALVLALIMFAGKASADSQINVHINNTDSSSAGSSNGGSAPQSAPPEVAPKPSPTVVKSSSKIPAPVVAGGTAAVVASGSWLVWAIHHALAAKRYWRKK